MVSRLAGNRMMKLFLASTGATGTVLPTLLLGHSPCTHRLHVSGSAEPVCNTDLGVLTQFFLDFPLSVYLVELAATNAAGGLGEYYVRLLRGLAATNAAGGLGEYYVCLPGGANRHQCSGWIG